MSQNFKTVPAPEPWCREITFSMWAFILGFALVVGIFHLVKDGFPAAEERISGHGMRSELAVEE